MRDTILIVPAYNMGGYIAETLESVLHQSYKNFYVLVVDDSSTDNTPDIVNKYVQADDRVKYVRRQKQPNDPKAPNNARNYGIEQVLSDVSVFSSSERSNLKYLALLDSDDILPEDSLKIRVDALRDNSVGMVYTDMLNFNGIVKGVKYNRKQTVNTYKQLIRQASVNMITHNSMMWNIDFINELIEHRRFDSISKYALFNPALVWQDDRDVATLSIVVANELGKKIVHVDKITYFYREADHPSASSFITRELKDRDFKIVDETYLSGWQYAQIKLLRWLDRPTYRLPKSIRDMEIRGVKPIRELEKKLYYNFTPLSDIEYTNTIFWFKNR